MQTAQASVYIKPLSTKDPAQMCPEILSFLRAQQTKFGIKMAAAEEVLQEEANNSTTTLTSTTSTNLELIYQTHLVSSASRSHPHHHRHHHHKASFDLAAKLYPSKMVSSETKETVVSKIPEKLLQPESDVDDGVVIMESSPSSSEEEEEVVTLPATHQDREEDEEDGFQDDDMMMSHLRGGSSEEDNTDEAVDFQFSPNSLFRFQQQRPSCSSPTDLSFTTTGSMESLLSSLSGCVTDSSVNDFDCCSSSATSPLSKTSPWRKVRSLVTSPFIQTYKRQKYPWIQLAGHQGNFLAGQMQGTILKKRSGNEDKCFQAIMEDELRDFVPQFKSLVYSNGESYIELEDLLANFNNPSIMDIKMGVRTYLEEELLKAGEKPKLRKDMYEKMVAIDPHEPKPEEHAVRAVTKPRYMTWRESISSTSTLGFRIDGVKLRTGAAESASRTQKDFKRTKSEESVRASILQFAENNPDCIDKYLRRLQLIRKTLQLSTFFRSHEMIGSSLLLVHDDSHADIWLIDFAKTYPLPAGVGISHRDPWLLGNHEDGYLTGLDNLIRLFSDLANSHQTERDNQSTITANDNHETVVVSVAQPQTPPPTTSSTTPPGLKTPSSCTS